nr:photosystem I P700 apoprotein A1 [Teucrium mascatense]QDF64445.1 photosystem I P700 apoprotein A1 [Teucrium mascatense]
MIIRSPEPEVKILVDKDPVKTSFEEWAKPGHFSRTIAKGPDTTTWIWNLHADAHDFDSHTSDLEEISRKVFSAHFGQLSIIFLWLSGMYFHGARFSNYEAWLSDPTHIGPSAQVVWPIVGQEILNGDVGGGFRGIQITSGFFQLWRASGITSELQLYCTAIGALVFAALMLFAGWFHYHKAAPKLAWFQDVESMLNSPFSGVYKDLGLSLGRGIKYMYLYRLTNFKTLEKILKRYRFLMNLSGIAIFWPNFIQVLPREQLHFLPGIGQNMRNFLLFVEDEIQKLEVCGKPILHTIIKLLLFSSRKRVTCIGPIGALVMDKKIFKKLIKVHLRARAIKAYMRSKQRHGMLNYLLTKLCKALKPLLKLTICIPCPLIHIELLTMVHNCHCSHITCGLVDFSELVLLRMQPFLWKETMIQLLDTTIYKIVSLDIVMQSYHISTGRVYFWAFTVLVCIFITIPGVPKGVLKICFQIPLYNYNPFLLNGYKIPTLKHPVQRLLVQRQAPVKPGGVVIKLQWAARKLCYLFRLEPRIFWYTISMHLRFMSRYLYFLKAFYLLVAPVGYQIKQILVFVFLVMDLEGGGHVSSIGLGSCLLRTILDVQFHFRSNIPFQLENAVRCLGQYKGSGGSNSYHGRKLCAKFDYYKWVAPGFLMGTGIPGNSVLWFFIICIWPFFPRCSFCMGFKFNVSIQWTWLLARTYRIHRLGSKKIKSCSCYSAESLEHCTRTCCRSNPLPSGWNCHNMGVLLSKNYCSRIMARRI